MGVCMKTFLNTEIESLARSLQFSIATDFI